MSGETPRGVWTVSPYGDGWSWTATYRNNSESGYEKTREAAHSAAHRAYERLHLLAVENRKL